VSLQSQDLRHVKVHSFIIIIIIIIIITKNKKMCRRLSEMDDTRPAGNSHDTTIKTTAYLILKFDHL